MVPPVRAKMEENTIRAMIMQSRNVSSDEAWSVNLMVGV